MEEISLKDLLEAGCHFGHQVNKSNPRARDFVFTARDGIQIIDLAKTKLGLEKAAEFAKATASQGGRIIFVGTKRQAKGVVKEEAERARSASSGQAPSASSGQAGVFYVTERWVGGTLTNWEEIRKNLGKMADLEEKIKNKEGIYTKREVTLFERELGKLLTLYGGIRGLEWLPDALFIVDTHKEEATVKEAIKKEVKIIGITDTNADPALIDYPIPANDDAVGSIKYIVHYLAEAWIEGKGAGEKVSVSRPVKEEPKPKTKTKRAAKPKPKPKTKAKKTK